MERVTGKTPVANEEANLSVLPRQVVLVESLAANVSDLLPRYLRKRLARELLLLAICGLCLLLGLGLLLLKSTWPVACFCRDPNQGEETCQQTTHSHI